MNKSLLIMPLFAVMLSACGDSITFETQAFVGTWHCQTNDHVSSFNSTTAYHADGTFSGSGNLRVDLPKEQAPALLKIEVMGTWSISGDQFTTNISKSDFEAKNPSGDLIIEEAQRLASQMKQFHSTIISVDSASVTFKEGNSYFKKTCLLE